VRWKLAGPEPTLTLLRSQPPPELVGWDDVQEAVAGAGADEVVVGVGKRGSIVKASLRNDSPHFGISMGSGGGKSTLAAFFLLQELSRGAIAIVLDAKWISHPWLIGLPNVAYCRTAPQIHAGLVWLSGELDRRNQVALRSVDARGTVHANIGPRLFVVAEELNLAMPRLRSYWAAAREQGDDKASPAITGFGEVAFAGRQVKMHMILIGQMLSAKSLGGPAGGEIRENVGVRCLARYSPNAWKMQAPEHPMPPRPTVLGRVQTVTAAGVRETQVPLVDLEHAREMVLAGKVTPCPAGMPGVTRVTDSPEIRNPAPDQPFVTVTAPAPVTGSGDAISLSEAVGLGIIRRSLAAARIARHRDEDFPEPAGHKGLAHLYDPAELAEWETRSRT
jgi:hypothetical protein